MTLTQQSPAPVARPLHSGPLRGIYAGNARAVMARGLKVMGGMNLPVVLSGFFEPVFYLLAMGYGLGKLIGDVDFYGMPIPYSAYIAPALMAVSAMNGAIMDSTQNVFFKLRYAKLYDQMMATSLGPLDVTLGEIFMALFRGLLYACGFLIITAIMGLNLSWTAILTLPAVVLISFAFAAVGMAVTSFMKTYQHLDYVTFVMLPMFLLSATFFPIGVYPDAVQWVVRALPLWHAVEIMRMLTTGVFAPGMLAHIGYFLIMIVIGLLVTTRRLRILFLS